jgi:16S rRNA (guanine527-N7)-methyltransferase
VIPLWTELAAAAGTPLSGRQCDQMGRYLDLLVEKNKVLNLTRITDRAAAETLHVADALTLLRHLPSPDDASAKAGNDQGQRRRLADVGTGGGVPGVILAIARPDLEVTLIDATRKKLDAVIEMASSVGLTNVRAVHGRIESVHAPFDVVTARAVADLTTLVGWCRGLLGPASVLLAMKGPRAGEELNQAGQVLRRARLSARLHDAAVPGLAGHVIVEVRPVPPSAASRSGVSDLT